VSWDETFSRRYDEWSSHMTEDIAFYTELAREADGPLVELAVGNGRVAIPVARATGRAVIGIDSSPAMLEQARKRAADAGVVLDLHEADMRAFSLAGQSGADLLSVPPAAPARSGGRRRTNGSGSSMSLVSSWRLSSLPSIDSRLGMTVANTCSSRAGDAQCDPHPFILQAWMTTARRSAPPAV
jgi:SAM-dependent methyltransferase